MKRIFVAPSRFNPKNVNMPKKGAMEIIGLIAMPLATLIGIWAGIWEFTSQQKGNNTQEFNRRIWEKRLNAYMDINAAAARVVVSIDNHDSLINATNNFEKVFWQNLPLIDDSDVEAHFVFFRDEVSDQITGNKNAESEFVLQESLRLAAVSCQKSITNSWNNLKH